MINKAVYPGSFDPITSGHLDIIKRAAELFGEVIIAVADNPRKKPLLPFDKRFELIKSNIKHLKNVRAVEFNGLLVNFCKENGAGAIIKGLRAISDFEYEFMMAQMNLKLEKNIETLFLMASPEFSYLSSSAVREIVKLGGSVHDLVPKNVENELKSFYLKERIENKAIN